MKNIMIVLIIMIVFFSFANFFKAEKQHPNYFSLYVEESCGCGEREYSVPIISGQEFEFHLTDPIKYFRIEIPEVKYEETSTNN